ncbi:MAG TPA: carboxypeptidase regulatory-like domain-containing protein [Verrucomicrobiae bacterium]|nr:carboxypeptidase regulatory-like domain-containing protein [Verrucomicrobiae bacterium]
MRKLFLGFSLLLFSAAAWSQTISTSQIRGVVQDPSGAAIAGAEVKLVQIATGATRTVTSGIDGSYTLPDLSVGTYQLEVTKMGFNKYVQKGIVLQVGVNPTINVSLAIGAVTQEVTVQAEAATVEMQNTGVGEVVAPQEVQDLPLNGRQVTDLLTLSAAVGQGRAFRASYPSSAVVSIGGGTQGSVSYWLDGGTHNDPLSNQNLPLPFPDTVEEFKVETSSLPAQYGVHPAGAVNAVTKSGSNTLHGDAFEYVRNYMFDSKNTAYANDLGGPYVRDNLKRNQFGGTVGGPIRRDRLFFFVGWQDTIQRSSNPATTTLPTADMLAGNFQPCLGTTAVLTAPFGTGGFGANQTDPANFSPIILALESHLPIAPTSATNECGTYTYQVPVNFNENQGVARIDYHWSDKNTLFGRYFISNWEQNPGAPNLPAADGGLFIAGIDGASNRVQNLTIGDTYLFSSNTVNDLRLTGNRSRNLTVQNSTTDLNDLFTEAGIPADQIGSIYQLGPQVSKFFPHYMAGFNVAGGFFGLFASTPSLQPYDTLEVSDSVALTRGAHQISFGTDFINLRAFAHNYLLNQGQFTFDGNRTNATPLPLASAGLADYLLGWTSAGTGWSQDAPIPSLQRQNVFGLYAQDAWKASRRLTVTVGLRWDPFFGHTDPKGHVVSISLPDIINDVHSTKFPTAPAGYLFNGDPGGPSNNKLSKNAMNEWSPRIGLAWDPTGSGRMSVRAGFGFFYDFPNFSYDQFGFEEPYGGAVNNPAVGTDGPCTTTCLTDPWGTLEGSPNPFTFTDQQGVTHVGQDPFGSAPGTQDYVGTGPQNAAYLPGALVFSYPQTIKPTYIMQYNLTVEKQLGSNWVVSVGYLGSQQRHLWGNNEANPGMQGPCPPGYPFPSGVACVADGGNVPNGPCPTTFFGSPLPPFVCPAIFGSGASLENNRMLQNYGTLCSPTTSCYGETLLLEEDLTGNYNALVLSARHPFARHFTSTTNFTWSHCISDNYTTTLGFFLAAQAMPFNRHYDRGNCPNADTHVIFNESLVAETPHFSDRTTQILLGNWRFSTSIIAQSGTDISPIMILDFSGSGNGLTQRPDLIPGADPYCQPKGRNCWLKPASFADPAPYVFGNLKNNSLFGPGSILVNTALSRLFPIGESQSVEFRWEVFNMPNHANLYAPQTAFVAPSFGQPTPGSTAGLGALNQTTNDARTMQFALKYAF